MVAGGAGVGLFVKAVPSSTTPQQWFMASAAFRLWLSGDLSGTVWMLTQEEDS